VQAFKFDQAALGQGGFLEVNGASQIPPYALALIGAGKLFGAAAVAVVVTLVGHWLRGGAGPPTN